MLSLPQALRVLKALLRPYYQRSLHAIKATLTLLNQVALYTIAIFTAALLACVTSEASVSYTFYYATPNNLKITVNAENYQTAYAKAAKLCFKALHPRYVDEEHGLDIIDICSNPVRHSEAL